MLVNSVFLYFSYFTNVFKHQTCLMEVVASLDLAAVTEQFGIW